jgi:dihydroorotase-like cyclic amidohydrolase
MLGIGGVEHSFSVMRHHLGDAVIEKMTSRTANLMGFPTKGKLAVGLDADVVLFKPMTKDVITGNHGRADYSIYEGCPSAGRVISTMVRGLWVLKDNQLIGGDGKWIKGSEII